ncbi:MAG: hypothetical protein ACOY5S_12080 [Pseudomonadota bacterium]
MFSRKPDDPQLPTHFVDAPAVFTQAWNDLADPTRIRREMAALLIADMRSAGPAWQTDRFAALNTILEDL